MNPYAPFVVGLDLGTTRCKAVALTMEGELLASAASHYRLYLPYPGWVEQNPEDVWQGAITALRGLADQCDSRAAQALCLSGAMHSLLPLDEQGNPLAPAMTWADQRAAPQARALRAPSDPQALYQRTGCPLQSTYHPARLRWYQEQGAHAARYVALKDWVLHHLTERWATDLGLASSSGLLDIHRLTWDSEALALSGIRAAQLPELVAPQSIVGALTEAAAKEIGWPAGLPVVAGASDGGLANLGAGALAPGERVLTVGTSGAIRQPVMRPYLDPKARSWCYLLVEGRWLVGGAINNGGIAVQWVRERFYADLPEAAGYAQLLADAARIEPGAAGLLFLPYLSGERSPHWEPEARATLHGLTLAHTRAHIARAALEGVAFCLAEVSDALPAQPSGAVARLTGQITRMEPWPQLLADVLGHPLAPVEAADASALGAAMLGQWALGHVPTLDAFATPIAAGNVLHPRPHIHERYQEIYKAFQALGRLLRHEKQETSLH